MEEQMRREAQERFSRHCETVRSTWAFQTEAGNHAAFLNGVRQMAEGIVGDLLEAMLAEKPDAVKSPKDIRKGPLDGKLSALRDNGWMDARMHAHFSILRVCGNFGSHQQDAHTDPELVASAARSLRICMAWYAETCLGIPFDLEGFLRQSAAYYVIEPERSSPDMSKRSRLRRVAGRARAPLASLASHVFQLVIVLVGTLALYLLLNRYGDTLLGMFGMKAQ